MQYSWCCQVQCNVDQFSSVVQRSLGQSSFVLTQYVAVQRTYWSILDVALLNREVHFSEAQCTVCIVQLGSLQLKCKLLYTVYTRRLSAQHSASYCTQCTHVCLAQCSVITGVSIQAGRRGTPPPCSSVDHNQSFLLSASSSSSQSSSSSSSTFL